MSEAVRTVGRYEILRRIGRGGMAVVHLARQTDLDRLVALKELNALAAEDASYARRFVQESRLAGSLSHPNIVHVYDYFEHDGTPFIAMEYVERGSLRRYVGQMTLAQMVGVLEGILAALTRAEQLGIVHRDLKPENVLVAPDGRIKLADFGIAKALNQVQTGGFTTATGMTVGTPAYMAPEQAMGGEVGPWTDLFAVGCMAYEFCVGNVPFAESEGPMALLIRRISEPVPSAATANPEFPPELADWIDRLLTRDPDERTRAASAALDELEDIVIALIGPRWRRSAQLPQLAAASASSPTSEGQGSFQAAAPLTSTVTPPPDDALPGTDSPPPYDAIPDAIPGPYTPPPDDAILPDELADADFLTFGRAADHPAPAPGQDPQRTDPSSGYQTYVPLPPARPPTAEPTEAMEPEGQSEIPPGPHHPGSAPSHAPNLGPTIASSRPTAVPRGRRRRGAAAVAILAGCVAVGAFVLIDGDEPPPRPPPPDSQANPSTPAPAPTVVARITAGDRPNTIAVTDGNVFVGSFRSRGLSVINPQSNALRSSAPVVGRGVADLQIAGDSLWVAVSRERRIVRLDARTGRRIGQAIEMPNAPNSVALGSGALWVGMITPVAGGNDTLARLDSRTARIASTLQVPEGIKALAVSPGAVWIASRHDPVVLKVSAATGKVLNRVRVGRDQPSDIAYANGVVWLTDPVANLVTRVDVRTGRTIEIGVRGRPQAIATDGDQVWVANYSDHTVTRIDPRTSRTVGDPVDVEPNPFELAISRGELWVTCVGEDRVVRIDLTVKRRGGFGP